MAAGWHSGAASRRPLAWQATDADNEACRFEQCRAACRFDITEAAIQGVLSEVHDLPPVQDVKAPETLLAAADLQALLEEHKPQFVPVRGREAEGTHPPPDAAAGVVQRRLSNGCTLNYKVSDNDPSSAGMRLCMSGGRAAEVTQGAGPAGVGAMQIGLRTSTPCLSPPAVSEAPWQPSPFDDGLSMADLIMRSPGFGLLAPCVAQCLVA